MQLDWITHGSTSKCCINKQKNSIEHFNKEEASEVWGIECAAPSNNTKIKVCARAYAYGRCWISNGIHFTCVKNRTKCSLSNSFLVHALIIIIKRDSFTPPPHRHLHLHLFHASFGRMKTSSFFYNRKKERKRPEGEKSRPTKHQVKR
jgi:hypothetical protein